MSDRIRRMLFPAFVATRLVRSRRSRRLSTVTMVSIIAVSFGVMALTVVLGITSGFQHAFQQRILGLYPHVVVMPRGGEFREYKAVTEQLMSLPNVMGATPATYDDMMMASGVHRAGAVVKGVDPSTVDEVVALSDLLREGSVDDLRETPTVTRSAGEIRIEDAVAGSWLTVVSSKRGVTLYKDPPLQTVEERVAVSLIDLRTENRDEAVRLQDAQSDVIEPDRKADVVFDDEPGAQGGGFTHRTCAQGLWRLNVTGDVFKLSLNSHATIVLFQGPDGRPASRILTRSQSDRVRERAAMVRLIHIGGDATIDAPQLGLEAPLAWGEFMDYRPIPAALPGLLVGVELAERLDVSMGSEVTLVTPLRGVDASMLGPSHVMPTSTRYRVCGIFESGFYEYDVRLGIVGLAAAQRFLNRGEAIRWIEVKGRDVLEVSTLKRSLQAQIDPFEFDQLIAQTRGLEENIARYARGDVAQGGPKGDEGFVSVVNDAVNLVGLLKYRASDFGYIPKYRLIDWQEMNANLFSALKLQKVVLTIFFLIIIIVGSFVVVGSQIMIIHEKTADIAILRAMGASAFVIRMIFTLQGLLVAGLGTLIGLGLGFGICTLITRIDYSLDASVYLIDRLPAELELSDAIVVAMATALCTLIASQYSAAKAAAKTPAEGIRAVD